MMVRRQVMLVCSSRGGRGPRFLTPIISDAGILEQGEVVVIPHSGNRIGCREANELLHGLNHPKFRDVVDRSLEEGQPSGIGERLLSGRYFMQLSELFIAVEDKLFSGTLPRFIQDSGGFPLEEVVIWVANSSQTHWALIVSRCFLTMVLPMSLSKHLLKTLYIKSLFNLNNSKLSTSLLGL